MDDAQFDVLTRAVVSDAGFSQRQALRALGGTLDQHIGEEILQHA